MGHRTLRTPHWGIFLLPRQAIGLVGGAVGSGRLGDETAAPSQPSRTVDSNGAALTESEGVGRRPRREAVARLPVAPRRRHVRPGGELAAGDLFGTLARRAQEGGLAVPRFNLQQLAIEREVTRGVCAPSTGGAQQGRCEGAGSSQPPLEAARETDAASRRRMTQ